MTVLIEVREFTLPTGTQTAHSLGGFGFQPKAVVFCYSGNDTDNTDSTTANGVVIGFGCCDGTREWAVASGTNAYYILGTQH